MARRFLHITALALVSLFTLAILAPPSLGFFDVTGSTEYGEAIESLRNRGVVEGYSDGTFKPRSTINRAEFLKIVLEGRDDDQVFTGSNCFPDVTDEWFAPYVCIAKDEGIIEGYPDGTFRPEQLINFVEASKIIANAFGQDVDEYAYDWFEPFVRALEGSNAIPPSVDRLDEAITRGEMAEMMWRLSDERTDQPTKSFLNVKYPEVAVNFAADEPQRATSCADLRALAAETQYAGYGGGRGMMEDMMMVPMAMEAMPSPAPTAGAEKRDYSETNVQVEGVDEADIVKTDGTYLYIVSENKVRIARAYPPSEMKQVSTIDLSDADFNPTELYIDGDNLLVLGSSWKERVDTRAMIAPDGYWPHSYSTAQVRIYDVSDHSNPTLKRKISFEGWTVSSRKIEDKLYLIVNQNPRWHDKLPPIPLAEDLLPRFEDSNIGMEEPMARCGDVIILPHPTVPNYLTVAVIPTRDTSKAVKREVILGNAQDVYSSLRNLYVTSTEWFYRWNVRGGGSHEKTTVLRFNFTEDGVEFQAKGTVPGQILNQFSMDEHENTFRIATTKGNMWNEENPSMNNLYILNMDMERVGEIEDIAPGEKIYSVRFMGDRAYMVTFKKVDPFFVIDTSDPRNPRILGKLKIPGYSDYMHPYDEDHIIGFGKEAAEAKEGDFAWYQGMKVALFDVSDVSNPRELHKVTIGDRGTESPLLNNHKALLFDKSRNLLSFPVTVNVIPDEQKQGYTGSMYGSPVFQGAYVYELTLSSGFDLRGTITHYDEETFLKAGDYWYDRGKNVQRIIRIEDSLLTISNDEVQSHSLDDVVFEGKIGFVEGTKEDGFEDVIY